MKAIGIKMVDLQPMTANEAIEKGYKTNNYVGEEKGYEVTYQDGYKSWSPKAVADKAYFKLADEHGETIKQEDIKRFVAKKSVITAGSKNTFARPRAIDQILNWLRACSPMGKIWPNI